MIIDSIASLIMNPSENSNTQLLLTLALFFAGFFKKEQIPDALGPLAMLNVLPGNRAFSAVHSFVDFAFLLLFVGFFDDLGYSLGVSHC